MVSILKIYILEYAQNCPMTSSKYLWIVILIAATKTNLFTVSLISLQISKKIRKKQGNSRNQKYLFYNVY